LSTSSRPRSTKPCAVKAKVAELGGSILPKSERTPAKFNRFVKAEIARWSPILKAASAETGTAGQSGDADHSNDSDRHDRPLRLLGAKFARPEKKESSDRPM
jgi:hypothetical protein